MRKSEGEHDFISDAQLLERFEDLRVQFESGREWALLELIFLCNRFQLIAPQWAQDAVMAIEERLKTGHLKDANAAFGAPEKPVDTRAGELRQTRAEREVLAVLVRLRSQGQPYSERTFGHALDLLRHQRRMNLNLRDVQQIYRKHKAVLETLKLKDMLDPAKKHVRYGVLNLVFPAPMRRGRRVLRD